MLQRKSLAVFTLCAILFGCSDRSPPPSSQPATSDSTSNAASRPNVAEGPIISLSPAATDLLLAMNLTSRLVGVSTYDSDRRVKGLPRVGDYENVDWERIATLAPSLMIVQMAPDRLPAGFRERAKELGITLHVAHIDRLEDILREITEISTAVGEPYEGERLRARIQRGLDRVREHVRGKPLVRTLLATSPDGLGAAGRQTYLDDLLVIAGGQNVVEANGYVSYDKEALLKMSPTWIFRFAPFPTDAERERMNRSWDGLQKVPAVRDDSLMVFDEDWALTPGSHVDEIANQIAVLLHGSRDGTEK